MLRNVIRLSLTVVVISMSAGFVIGAGYAQERPFAVKGVVVDPSGAVIPQAEVVFKGNSGAIVAHTGMDGAVNVNLDAGKYLVTISAFAFATMKLVDFSVPGPTSDAFRVSLKIDQSQTHHGWGPGGPPVSTVPSELPNIIKDEPTSTSLPVVPPVATGHRSMRCLFLWRCSASHP